MIHVLIVDDGEAERKRLKLLLEFNGYRVTAAGDGVEALECASKERPDAVISDVLMPRMDGFVLCDAWMKDTQLRDIPFIFYTAYLTSGEDERVASVLGAARYLIKPMLAEVFLQELRTALLEWVKPSHAGI